MLDYEILKEEQWTELLFKKDYVILNATTKEKQINQPRKTVKMLVKLINWWNKNRRIDMDKTA